MGLSIRSELKTIGKHSSIYGLATVLNQIVGFLLLPLYTRYLTTSDYGTLEILYFVASIVSITIGVGIGQAMSRFYFDAKEQTERNKVVSTTYLCSGVFSIIGSLILISVARPISQFVFDTADLTLACIVLFCSLGINFMVSTAFGYYRVEQKSIQVTFFSVSKLILTIGLNILFLVVLEMGVLGILLGTLVADVVAGLVMTIPILRTIGLKFSMPVFVGMMKFGLPLIPSSIAAYLIIASDRYFVKEYVSLAQAGLYTLGYKFGTLVGSFVTSSFIQIWYPRRYELFGKEGSDEMFSRIFTYFMSVIVFGVLGVSLFSADVIVIMTTEKFWPAAGIVPIIALSQLFHALFYHFEIGISYYKKTVYFTYINFFTAAVNLGLNFLLIPEYGWWGAAWSTVITYIVRASLCFYFSNRLHPLEFEGVRVAKLFVAGGIAYYLGSLLDLGSPMLNLGLRVIPLFGFAGLLFLMKFFTDDEIRAIGEGLDSLRARFGGGK